MSFNPEHRRCPQASAYGDVYAVDPELTVFWQLKLSQRRVGIRQTVAAHAVASGITVNEKTSISLRTTRLLERQDMPATVAYRTRIPRRECVRSGRDVRRVQTTGTSPEIMAPDEWVKASRPKHQNVSNTGAG